MSTRVFRYRLYPTARQSDALGQMLRDHCTLYNAALQERRDAWSTKDFAHERRTNRKTKEVYDAWRHVGKGTGLRYGDQSAQLKAIRTDDQYRRWSFSSQQQTLKRLDKAFQAFFRRIKRGDTPGYPRFKPHQRFDTVTFIHGDGGAYLPDDARVRMQGIGHVKVKQHRPVRGTIKQFSVTREGRHWYVNVICTDVPDEIRPLTGAVIGLDRGVKDSNLLADSDGGFVSNPRHYRRNEARLAEAQRALSQKTRGSKRRRKAVERVARVHRTVRRSRADHLHKTSRALVDSYDLIALETLRPGAMSRRPAPKPDPAIPGQFLPNGAAQKSGLSKSILDAGWTALASMIQYKAECAGIDVVFVPAPNTSRMCHECGHTSADNRDDDEFLCGACGHSAHADTNAARNILRLGLSLHDSATAAS